jgi:hypothetical protein
VGAGDLTLVAEYRCIARVLAAAALVPSLVSFGVRATLAGGAFLASDVSRLHVAVVPVLAAAAFHPESPPVRERPWLVALPVGVVAVTVLGFLPQHPGSGVLIDMPRMACVFVCVAGVAYLAAPGLGWGGQSASWSVALAVLGTGVLGLRLVTFVDYLGFADRTEGLYARVTVGVVEAIATAAITAVLSVVGGRALNALSASEAEQRLSPG